MNDVAPLTPPVVDSARVGADVDDALRTVIAAFGRRVGAAATLLAVLEGDRVRPRSAVDLDGAGDSGLLDELASRAIESVPGEADGWVHGMRWQRAGSETDGCSFLAVEASAGPFGQGFLWAALPRPPRDLHEVVVVAREHAELAAICLRHETTIKRLEHAANHDMLTGCLNRGGTSAALLDEVARCGRHSRPLAVCFLDLDHFKEVNDTGGHVYGDRVLAEVGSALRSSTRPYDLVGRVGGDEFLVIMPETDHDGAEAAVTRLTEAMSAAVEAATERSVTASIGIAEWRPGMGAVELWSRADDALQAAKRSRAGTAEARRRFEASAFEEPT